MQRRSSLTVKKEEVQEIVTIKSTGFVVRGKQEEGLQAPQAQALLIQELEVNFDADLRLAMLQRLVQSQEEIKSQASQEEQLAKVVELGRLAAIASAKEKGIQKARSEYVKKQEGKKRQQQEAFMKTELPKLLEACRFMEVEDLKTSVTVFADRLQVKLTWEENESGELRCIPSI